GSTINITGGTQAGGNLFHSFKEFSVPTGSEALFHNGADIQNIITRVTGGSISNIDGIIHTLGTANLFLINPSGIVFGPNASLNVGGSFIGSTAKSINFADGTIFSSTPTESAALLTVSVPLGLQFGSNPGEIKVLEPGYQFSYDDYVIQQTRPPLETSVPGLAVNPGQTLALVGGKVSVSGGVLTSPTGRIEIGSVDSLQSVNLVPVQLGWMLGYPDASSLGDTQISGKSFVSTTGVGGGSIAIAGKNINLKGQSILVGDTLVNRNGGTTRISGENIVVDQSLISSNTYGSGSGGKIQLDANNIAFQNQGSVVVQTQGKGDGGTINVLGKNSLEIESGSLASSAQRNSTGNAGDVNVNVTGSIKLSNVGITTNTLGAGGNAGNINITGNSLVVEKANIVGSTTNTGKSGEINIHVAGPLTVDSTRITTNTSSTGDAGKINITADSFQIEGATISSSTMRVNSTGKAGNITLKVPGQLTIDQTNITTNTSGTGDAGKIYIDAGSIEFGSGSQLNTNTNGKGKAGTINIKANSFQIESGANISSNAGKNSTETAGDITLNITGPLTIDNGNITTDTSGTGNAGKINITADSFQVKGADISSNTYSTGKAGEINIDAGLIEIGPNAGLNTNTSNKGDAGRINIKGNSFVLKGGTITSNTDNNSTGNAGDITVNVAGQLTINTALINTNTSGTGDAGKINITANSLQVARAGINSRTSENSIGKAGDI
ncbi:MAG: filamentous hemagglutinin N-terminal domain-containing protein, partial [Stigonema ocellatum SAG 48.90 = DSM 106950]|nr:filamentous hemagglutinin N-terminal domain-containing protein [Stigonema ocellatum SAG 48.90 = DSM 106950]